jgi:hypothetical protein
MATTARHARAEFGWIYLQSLIETAEDRLAAAQAGRHRIRTWRAARRLRELEAYRAHRHLPPGSQPPSPPRAALASATVGLVCTVAAMLALAAGSSDGSVPALADLATLALALIWFALALACLRRPGSGTRARPRSAGDADL